MSQSKAQKGKQINTEIEINKSENKKQQSN